jgi:hypothetical protein
MMETNRPSKDIDNDNVESVIFAPFALANADVIYYNTETRDQRPETRDQRPETRATVL